VNISVLSCDFKELPMPFKKETKGFRTLHLMLYDLEITLCSMLYALLVFYEAGRGHLLNISLQINVV
jgi:hypothetical protein